MTYETEILRDLRMTSKECHDHNMRVLRDARERRAQQMREQLDKWASAHRSER